MKILTSAIFRILAALTVGCLLVANPTETLTGITIVIGLVFLISGVISCVAYYIQKRKIKDVEITDQQGRHIIGGEPFPIASLGSVLVGFILALMPATFVSSLMYVLGGLIILAAISQFVSLVSVREQFKVPFVYWVFPSLTLIVGLLVIVKPMESASLPLLLVGWCMIFYGVTEALSTIKIHYAKRKMAKQEAGESNETEAK